ncbi:MAG TPA: hypothetical protein VIO14_06735 [Dehalococcoidia bacterium]
MRRPVPRSLTALALLAVLAPALALWGTPERDARADRGEPPCPGGRTAVRLELAGGVLTAEVCAGREAAAVRPGLRLRLPGGLVLETAAGPPLRVTLRLDRAAPKDVPAPEPPPALPDGGKQAGPAATGPPEAGPPPPGSGGTQVVNVAVDLRDGVQAAAADQGCRVYQNVRTAEITIGRLTVNCP